LAAKLLKAILDITRATQKQRINYSIKETQSEELKESKSKGIITENPDA